MKPKELKIKISHAHSLIPPHMHPLSLCHALSLSLSHPASLTHSHSLSLVLVVMMRSAEFKICSGADSPWFSLTPHPTYPIITCHHWVLSQLFDSHCSEHAVFWLHDHWVSQEREEELALAEFEELDFEAELAAAKLEMGMSARWYILRMAWLLDDTFYITCSDINSR